MVQIPNELATALRRFDDKGQEVIDSLVRALDSQPAPSTIYHYTNDSGLRGILESGRLWLSDIFSLNDPSELKHGISHAVTILNGRAERGPSETKVFATHFADFLNRAMPGTAHYFVCSFSSDGDDLGQWRAYGDNGRGYALGFDGRDLEDAFTKANGTLNRNNSTHHVTYNDDKLIDIDRRLIDSMFDLISAPRGKGMDSDSVNEYMKKLSVSISIHALRAALFFKHEAYKNEREFRFMEIHRADVPLPEVKRRSRSYEIVKYREFDWRSERPGALKEIVVGPAADREKAQRFAADCIAEFKAPAINVYPSKIPYRTV